MRRLTTAAQSTAEPEDTRPAAALIEQCFRENWRAMVLSLTRRFGTGRLDDIENALQTAMLRALDSWPIRGLPDNPAGWIVRVAQNLLIDGARRAATASGKRSDVQAALYASPVPPPRVTEPLEDEALRMMMVCAHPALRPRDTVVITLRLICGLTVSEIARGLLSSDEAVKRQLTRSKNRIRDLGISFELPPPDERDGRLDRILQCIYLLFNEGYAAYTGENLIRRELCNEAERLVELLLRSRMADEGKVWALAALLAFQASRHRARCDAEGRLVRLSDQDRGLWDRNKIAYGFDCLNRSMTGDRRSRYHLEAAIAACHAAAPSEASTDWGQIREFYDHLAALAPSPVVELNRSVAVLMTEGPEAAIEVLTEIESTGGLEGMYLLPALLGDFHRRAGHLDEARACYGRALTLAHNKPVQQFLVGQTEACMLI